MFKIGDVVTIHPSSVFYNENDSYNPANMEGIITATRLEGLYTYRVMWENGHKNVYNACDLELSMGLDISDFL